MKSRGVFISQIINLARFLSGLMWLLTSRKTKYANFGIDPPEPTPGNYVCAMVTELLLNLTTMRLTHGNCCSFCCEDTFTKVGTESSKKVARSENKISKRFK
jgi:hypothetical protein